MRLLRAEWKKVFTTNTWWIFALILIPLWGFTLFINYFQTQFLADPEALNVPPDDPSFSDPAVIAARQAENIAANLYTNGQLTGLAIIMVLGIIIMTSEFFHQTATTTFLTTPHRSAVIVAKFVVAGLLGVLFWVVTTAANLLVAPLILNSFDTPTMIDSPAIWRSIGLNGLAYLLWALFGVGIGVLIRSQIAATVTAIVLYFAGSIGAVLILQTLANRFGDWINNLQVIVPSLASGLMVSGTDLPGSPPQWVGAAVLIGYAVVTGVVGTLITRTRDVS
jgi:ABC-type transport system involved in multi-copper enzyme maturation permease subunit